MLLELLEITFKMNYLFKILLININNKIKWLSYKVIINLEHFIFFFF